MTLTILFFYECMSTLGSRNREPKEISAGRARHRSALSSTLLRGETRRRKKKIKDAKRAVQRAIPHRIDVRRQRARLLDISGSLRVLRPALSLSSLLTERAHVVTRPRRGSIASEQLSLSVSPRVIKRSSSLAPGRRRGSVLPLPEN